MRRLSSGTAQIEAGRGMPRPYDEERPFVGATHASPCGLTPISASVVRLRIRCKVSGSRQSRPAATPAQSPMRSSTRRSRSATERTTCQTPQLRPTERARAQGIGVAGGNCGGERQGSGKSSLLWLSGTPIRSGRSHGADGRSRTPTLHLGQVALFH